MRNAKDNLVRGLGLAAVVGLAMLVPSSLWGKEDAPAPKEAPEAKAPTTQPAGATVELKIEVPRPLFEGTPKNIKEKMRPPKKDRRIMVPKGLELKNVALKKRVTSSDEEPIIGELSYVTDGDKEGTDGSFVELGPGLQWVQIDLGSPQEIHVFVIWHYHREGRVYRDVIVQVADDKDFITNVRTIFNNDHDNSAGLGIGKDWQYLDDYKGEDIQPKTPVTARYVRLYSNGNTSNDLNHYTEVEIYGRPAPAKDKDK